MRCDGRFASLFSLMPTLENMPESAAVPFSCAYELNRVRNKGLGRCGFRERFFL